MHLSFYLLPKAARLITFPVYTITSSEGGNMRKYESDIERQMREFYDNLSERGKRHYAATEAVKLGHGGIVYISKLLGCSRNTVSRGIRELKSARSDSVPEVSDRRPGGGRKPYEYHLEYIDEKFLDILKNHTAGNPMKRDIVWTNLRQQEIADILYEKHCIRVSRTVIRKLLGKHGYKRRKAQKKVTMKTAENRNEQFENIVRLRAEYEKAGHPAVSIDTKKKNSSATSTVTEPCIPVKRSGLSITISAHSPTA